MSKKYSTIVARPCDMGQSKQRDCPANAEMALAFALHDNAQMLLMFADPKHLATSPDAYRNWLRTVKQTIAFYEEREAANAN